MTSKSSCFNVPSSNLIKQYTQNNVDYDIKNDIVSEITYYNIEDLLDIYFDWISKKTNLMKNIEQLSKLITDCDSFFKKTSTHAILLPKESTSYDNYLADYDKLLSSFLSYDVDHILEDINVQVVTITNKDSKLDFDKATPIQKIDFKSFDYDNSEDLIHYVADIDQSKFLKQYMVDNPFPVYTKNMATKDIDVMLALLGGGNNIHTNKIIYGSGLLSKKFMPKSTKKQPAMIPTDRRTKIIQQINDEKNSGTSDSESYGELITLSYTKSMSTKYSKNAVYIYSIILLYVLLSNKQSMSDDSSYLDKLFTQLTELFESCDSVTDFVCLSHRFHTLSSHKYFIIDDYYNLLVKCNKSASLLAVGEEAANKLTTICSNYRENIKQKLELSVLFQLIALSFILQIQNTSTTTHNFSYTTYFDNLRTKIKYDESKDRVIMKELVPFYRKVKCKMVEKKICEQRKIEVIDNMVDVYSLLLCRELDALDYIFNINASIPKDERTFLSPTYYSELYKKFRTLLKDKTADKNLSSFITDTIPNAIDKEPSKLLKYLSHTSNRAIMNLAIYFIKEFFGLKCFRSSDTLYFKIIVSSDGTMYMTYSPALQNYIYTCEDTFVFIPMIIVYENDTSKNHANMLFIDKKSKQILHYEPNGAYFNNKLLGTMLDAYYKLLYDTIGNPANKSTNNTRKQELVEKFLTNFNDMTTDPDIVELLTSFKLYSNIYLFFYSILPEYYYFTPIVTSYKHGLIPYKLQKDPSSTFVDPDGYCITASYLYLFIMLHYMRSTKLETIVMVGSIYKDSTDSEFVHENNIQTNINTIRMFALIIFQYMYKFISLYFSNHDNTVIINSQQLSDFINKCNSYDDTDKESCETFFKDVKTLTIIYDKDTNTYNIKLHKKDAEINTTYDELTEVEQSFILRLLLELPNIYYIDFSNYIYSLFIRGKPMQFAGSYDENDLTEQFTDDYNESDTQHNMFYKIESIDDMQ